MLTVRTQSVYYSQDESTEEISIIEVMKHTALASGDIPFPELLDYNVVRISVGKDDSDTKVERLRPFYIGGVNLLRKTSRGYAVKDSSGGKYLILSKNLAQNKWCLTLALFLGAIVH